MVFQIMIPFQYKCIFEGIFFTIHTSYILKVVFVCMSDFDEQNMVITDQILIKSLKNLIFGCVAPGHWNSRKMEIIVLFWQISLFWPQCIPIMIQQSKKLVQSCFNTDFEIFTKKLGVLPRLPEYPLDQLHQVSIGGVHSPHYASVCRERACVQESERTKKFKKSGRDRR